MKKLFTVFLAFAALLAYAQVSYSFTTQTADFITAQEGSYKIVKNEQSNGFTTQIGSPKLPVFTKRLVLPIGSIVTNVVVSNQNQVLIGNNITLYPAQPPQDWSSQSAFVLPDPAIYNSVNAFPVNTVTKTGDETSQGYRIVTLDICPFRYIPSQKQLYLYNSVNITIQYTIGTIEYTEKITERRHQITKEWVVRVI